MYTLILTVVSLPSLLWYWGTPWIANGILDVLASGTIRRYTAKPGKHLCVLWYELRKDWEYIHRFGEGMEGREQRKIFGRGQYVLKRECSETDNNPKGWGESKTWCPCNGWVPVCVYASSFTPGNEVVSRFARWQKRNVQKIFYLILPLSLFVEESLQEYFLSKDLQSPSFFEPLSSEA